MKRSRLVIIIVIVALASGIIGFVIGRNIDRLGFGEMSYVGTYRTNSWNGNKEAVIALKYDKTMEWPNGHGTWHYENGVILLDSEQYKPGTSGNANDVEKSIVQHKLTIVDKGLMYGGHFFEKISR